MRFPLFPRWLKLTGITLALFAALAGGGVLFLEHNPAAAALFADHVMRPLLGDNLTIALERLMFQAQDSLNQVRHQEPDTASYTQTTPLPSIAPVVEVPTPAVALPTTIIPQAFSPSLPGEGEWHQLGTSPLSSTFLRTDPERKYAVVNLVHLPMNQVSIDAMAGTKFPGGPAGEGKVPQAIQDSGKLIAAFNGGFQGKDGHYGMYAHNTTYLPLRPDLGTLFLYIDGHAAIGKYSGKTLDSSVMAARQNGPLIVENSTVSPLTSQGISLWAGTAAGGYVTWRSGLGITAKGDLLYAVGPSLTPTALAKALQQAGSVTAMQLDVNTYWVRFMLYQWQDNHYSWTPLVKDLADGGAAYLNGYEKDFFYVSSK